MEGKQMQQQQPKYAVPIGLNYRLQIADAVPASHNISQFLASNASVFTESNNTVRINVSSGGFLDLKKAVLELDLKNTTTETIHLDGSAECVINRIRILSSDGSEIERIDQYGQLASVLEQYTSSDGSARVKSIQKGSPRFIDETASFVSVPSAADPAAGAQKATAYETGISVSVENTTSASPPVNNKTKVIVEGKGGVGYSQLQCDQLATLKTRKYSFGLKLGFFNPATNKLLPPNTPFQLEISLGKAAECLVNKAGTAAVAYEVQNCELHVPTVVVNDPEYMASVNARLSGGVSFKCNSYNHFVNTTSGGGTGKDTIQISARARSLKGLMSIMRKQSKISSDDDFKLSKRTIQYISDYQYKINSTNYPVDRVNVKIDGGDVEGGTISGDRLPLAATEKLNVCEAYNHAMRLFGGLNSANTDCLIGVESFAQSENANNNGTGLMCIDLSAFSDGSVNSGINTLNNGVVQLEITKTVACNDVVQIDTYSVHELIVIRSPAGVLQSIY
jgi:hypothetical protein